MTSLGRLTELRVMKSAVTVAVATLAIVGVAPAGAAASVIYWKYRHTVTGTCLTTYASGKILTLPCEQENNAQEWHWINSSWNGDYRLLKNKWTGKCLISTEPVSSGSCEDWTSRHWGNVRLNDGTYLLLNSQTRKYLIPVSGGVGLTDSLASSAWQAQALVIVKP
ncbi:hypothetical protein [Nonomuraea sp. SYSU D8015]|uniref:hypothetical protein n=1 Tax=Nonomuraea sp. SYSU D8015 TaxID=2593644 RepID=UPI001660568B|nr:hypothetical protein [Nonomuraea sp. SYSU D8015]